MMGFGGHAMCVVGYDEKKYGGAFLIMNSWGPEWGNNGFAWVRYPEFNYFVREAYGLEPMARTGQAAATLECEIGLVPVQFGPDKKMIPGGYIRLNRIDSNLYRTASPISIGSKFKVEIKNNNECYIYVLGKETDGSVYTLFPYPTKEDPSKTKYSAFCGITGYRLFPRDKSMTPDSIGNRDMIAVLVSRNELDWYAIQTSINRQLKTLPLPTRIRTAIPGSVARGVQYSESQKGNIRFTANTSNNEVVYCIVEFDKQ
jgi:Papain family cysteine protease